MFDLGGELVERILLPHEAAVKVVPKLGDVVVGHNGHLQFFSAKEVTTI
jgi:hypothetical protein